MSFTRRRFLKWVGLSGGALALGTVGGVALIQPRRHLLARPTDDDRRPERPATPRRVVVVGGGLAGIAAATELAARGFAVTLVERSPELGGKLTGWPVQALGEEFPVEHGFHGFFSQYYNLRELFAAAHIGDDLIASPNYPVLFGDGHGATGDLPVERFGHTTKIFPLNLLSVVRQSQRLRFMDFARDGRGGALTELMRYDEARTFARFDGIDFDTFSDGQINQPMVDSVLRPFGKTTLNRTSRLSAAEAIRFFHFYFMGNPEGLAFQFTQRDSMTAVIRPLARRLEQLGATVSTGQGAVQLHSEAGRVTAVTVGLTPLDSPGGRPIPLPDDVPSAGWRALPQADGSSIFVGRRGDKVVALDGHCTHMGCPIKWVDTENRFACPCHGGVFNAEGQPVAGPPKAPLVQLTVVGNGIEPAISAATSSSATLPCDYCVVACEVRGAKALLQRSQLPAPTLNAGVTALGEADPYVVYRLWLDRAIDPSRNAFYTTSRFDYTDSLALYSLFQEPYVSWARRTGGSVVEVHAYAIAPEKLRPAQEIRAAMRAELWRLVPELTGARVLHEEYQQQSNFSRWAPGDWATRPSTRTDLPNLFMAGDHVKLPAPASLMEAAAMSGRLAANAILEAEGCRQLPIYTVAPKGPLV